MASQTVVGADRLAATLNKAARDLARMDAASTRAASVVATDARSKAPKATGRLSRSVTPKASGNVAQVAATAPYGMFVEYGTSRSPAQPFMRPALTAQTVAVVNVYTVETETILNQVKGA